MWPIKLRSSTLKDDGNLRSQAEKIIDSVFLNEVFL